MKMIKRNTILDIQNKKGKEKLVCLTAYSFVMAKILDEYCDILLVGDSLAMTIYGMTNTLSVEVETMINHGKAVVNGSKKALVVVDLPFGSYEKSKEQAFETASKIISQTGCGAVKLESSSTMAETVEFLTLRGIPVMGHVGLMPQHINILGGYKYQGKDSKQAEEILQTSLKIADSGAFSLVIEGVTEKLADEISQKLSIPTIGIGASAKCDGQILVTHDMLGLNEEFKPKFVKHYSNLADQIRKAAREYKAEVKNCQFPAKEHCL